MNRDATGNITSIVLWLIVIIVLLVGCIGCQIIVLAHLSPIAPSQVHASVSTLDAKIDQFIEEHDAKLDNLIRRHEKDINQLPCRSECPQTTEPSNGK